MNNSDTQSGAVYCMKCGSKLPQSASERQKLIAQIHADYGENIIFCNECGMPLSPDGKPYNANSNKKKYCPHCGSEIFQNTSQCQKRIGDMYALYGENITFCPECGAPLAPDSESHKNDSAPSQDSYSTKYKKSENEHKASDSTRQTVYEGELHKCPNCGKLLDAFVTKCPDCGYELRGTDTSAFVQKFAVQLSNAKDINEKTTLIRNLPMPNTKEDIFELMFLASTNINSNPEIYVPDSIIGAWFAKLDQCYMKAKFLFGDDSNFDVLQSLYDQTYETFEENKEIRNQSKQKKRRNLEAEQRKAARLKERELRKSRKYYSEERRKDRKSEEKIKSKPKSAGRILIIGLLLLVGFIFLLCFFLMYKEESAKSDFSWPTVGLSTKLPVFASNDGYIYTNNDTELDIRVNNVSYAQFENYVSLCKQNGFKVNSKNDTNEYTAYNNDGYFLKLSLLSDLLSIELKAPLNGDPNFKWSDHKIALKVPEFSGKTGSLEIENDDTVEVYLYKITTSDFQTYIVNCEDKGFNIDTVKDGSSFEGFDSEGYKLTLFLRDMEVMSITLESPMEMSKYTWSKSNISDLMPKPVSDMGHISYETDDSFSIYIANTSIDDFNEYIDQCLDSGFNYDYSRYEKSFYADNIHGDRLWISYYGFNIMYISIDLHD